MKYILMISLYISIYANDEIELEKLCKNGHIKSCYDLGNLYKIGEYVVKNYNIASKYYRIACDGNNSSACNSLGVFYTYGRGVKENYVMAYVLYDKSCKLGSNNGCLNKASMKKTLNYIESFGIDIDAGKRINSETLESITSIHKGSIENTE